jgi:hypothetical protein
MIGLGQIPTLGNTSNRILEMRLFQEVARVDEKEAEQGALHSDSLRLSQRDQEDNHAIGRNGLAQRLSSLWRQIKRKSQETPDKTEEEDCPVAQARSRSVIGANAPLGWLTLDKLFQGEIEGLDGPSRHRHQE